MDLVKRYKAFLMNTASWHTMRWFESVAVQFPRQRPQPTDLGKTETGAWFNRPQEGTIIYRT